MRSPARRSLTAAGMKPDDAAQRVAHRFLLMSVPPAPDRPPSRVATPVVADFVAQTLHAYGVRFAFGIPGNDVLETVRACEAHGIGFVLAKSEPSAAFMADAVWQLTGQPAVLIDAFVLGVANAIYGIDGPLLARFAVIVLCGEMAASDG